MSLYLCIFDGPDEIAGLDVGSYDDFGRFRDAVHVLEAGDWGSRFPTLLNHADADGRWTPVDLPKLSRELQRLRSEPSLLGLRVSDGRPVADALAELCDTARAAGLPIEFQ